MKKPIYSSLIAFTTLALLFAVKCFIEGKGLDVFIAGTLIMGSVWAVGAFISSLATGLLLKKVKIVFLPFVAPAIFVSGTLYLLNLHALSDSMTITVLVAMTQAGYYAVFGIYLVVVSYILYRPRI